MCINVKVPSVSRHWRLIHLLYNTIEHSLFDYRLLSIVANKTSFYLLKSLKHNLSNIVVGFFYCLKICCKNHQITSESAQILCYSKYNLFFFFVFCFFRI